MRQFDASNRPKILIFMTDGLPTVGLTDPGAIVANASRAKTLGLRLFTFGVGYDVNTALLDKLAAENGGVADYVEPKEDLEVKVSNFFSKVNYPVLTDLKLDMAGVQTDLVYPRAMPDVFRGSQVVLIGRYRNPIDLDFVRLQLTGNSNGANKTFFYNNLRFPVREETNDFLPRLWATRRVGWLMEQVRTNGEQQELREEIVDLGTRYGIVTPYTSYLALEPGAAPTNVATNGRLFGTARGMNAPASAPPPKAADANAITGAGAVVESKRARAQQDVVRVYSEEEASSVARVAGGKTFYLRDGVWTDAELKGKTKLPETVVGFGTEAYFELLKQKPRLGVFFSLGEKVVVVFEGQVYRVNAAN